MKLKDDLIYEINASSKIKAVEGIITELSPVDKSEDSYHLITLEDENGNLHKFQTDSKTNIYREEKLTNGKNLKLKDKAYIEGEYDFEEEVYLAKKVKASINIIKVKGNVTEITKIYNKNTLVTVKDWYSGKKNTYELRKDSQIIVDNKVVSKLPENPGYFVEVDLEVKRL